MGENAAMALLRLASSWKHTVQGANSSVATQRGDSTGLGDEFWRNELEAVRHLLEVEAFVATREEHALYEGFLEEIREFVFAPRIDWVGKPTSIDSATRLHLHQLGLLMEATPTSGLELTPAQVEGLQNAARECLEILDTMPASQDKGLEYLREVLTGLQKLLDGDDIDFEAVRDSAYKAVGVAAIHARTLPEETRNALSAKLLEMVVPFALATASGATANLLSEGITSFAGLLGT